MYWSCIDRIDLYRACIECASGTAMYRACIETVKSGVLRTHMYSHVSCMYRTGQFLRARNALVLTCIVHVSKISNLGCMYLHVS